MFFKLSKIAMFVFLLFTVSAVGQSTADAEKQRQEYEKKAQDELEKRVNSFLDDLKDDDFQKEIIKQKIHSYFQERKSIYMDASLKYFERDEKIRLLPETHFSDIKNLISEDTMDKIKSFVSDGGVELKKEKKKNKRKNKKEKELDQD